MSGSPCPETDGVPGRPDAAAGQAHRDQRITVKVEVVAGVVTVFIVGELDLVTMPVLAARLEQILRDDPAQIVFDLAGTAFADIGSARLLVRAWQVRDGRAAAGDPPSAARRTPDPPADRSGRVLRDRGITAG